MLKTCQEEGRIEADYIPTPCWMSKNHARYFHLIKIQKQMNPHLGNGVNSAWGTGSHFSFKKLEDGFHHAFQSSVIGQNEMQDF